MKRFLALDVFRGLTIFLMIIVNTPGDWRVTFSPLLHADWHGFTPTDLVFPSFLFAVGNALFFVDRKWKDRPFGPYFWKVLKRTLIIFLIGYLLFWFPFVQWESDGSLTGKPFAETRILGVLQRIALCYFAAALSVRFLSMRALFLGSVAVLLAYWGILYVFGDYTLEGNAVRTLDLWLMGDAHLYHGDGIGFDPEGLLSTLPAVVNVIAGYLFGHYLVTGSSEGYEKIARTMMAGLVLCLAAYLWDLVFPVNKKLWTSSYVLLTVGLDLLLIAVIIFATELVSKPRPFTFLQVFGRNPLFIYVLSEFLLIITYFLRVPGGQSLHQWIYTTFFEPIGPYAGSLAFALFFTLLCWLAGWWLWRRGIVIKV